MILFIDTPNGTTVVYGVAYTLRDTTEADGEIALVWPEDVTTDKTRIKYNEITGAVDTATKNHNAIAVDLYDDVARESYNVLAAKTTNNKLNVIIDHHCEGNNNFEQNVQIIN